MATKFTSELPDPESILDRVTRMSKKAVAALSILNLGSEKSDVDAISLLDPEFPHRNDSGSVCPGQRSNKA